MTDLDDLLDAMGDAYGHLCQLNRHPMQNDEAAAWAYRHGAGKAAADVVVACLAIAHEVGVDLEAYIGRALE